MDSNQGEPLKALTEQIKRKVSIMEIRDGKKPTFETYIYEMMEEGIISMDNLEMEIRAIALGWSGARLGTTNWKALYNQINEEFVTINNVISMKPSYKEEIAEENSSEVNNVSKRKQNKVFEFIVELFREIDKEIIGLFKNFGILGITVFVLLVIFIWYLATVFDKESYFILAVILGLGLYVIQLGKDSKLGKVISFIGILGVFIVGIIMIYVIGEGIFDFLKDLFN